jgi:hypothetical protein
VASSIWHLRWKHIIDTYFSSMLYKSGSKDLNVAYIAIVPAASPKKLRTAPILKPLFQLGDTISAELFFIMKFPGFVSFLRSSPHV